MRHQLAVLAKSHLIRPVAIHNSQGPFELLRKSIREWELSVTISWLISHPTEVHVDRAFVCILSTQKTFAKCLIRCLTGNGYNLAFTQSIRWQRTRMPFIYIMFALFANFANAYVIQAMLKLLLTYMMCC